MRYAIYYALNDLVSWLCRAPLLWDIKDIIIIACELYAFYYITGAFCKLLIAKIKVIANKKRANRKLVELEKLYKRKRRR